jgi:hypothetical protein
MSEWNQPKEKEFFVSGREKRHWKSGERVLINLSDNTFLLIHCRRRFFRRSVFKALCLLFTSSLLYSYSTEWTKQVHLVNTKSL